MMKPCSMVELLKWMMANRADAQIYPHGHLLPNGEPAPGSTLVLRLRHFDERGAECGLEQSLDIAVYDDVMAQPESMIGVELFRLQRTLKQSAERRRDAQA